MFHYTEFRFIVIFLFRYPFFQAVRLMGFLKCLVMNFYLSPSVCEDRRVTERHSSAAFSEGV